MYIYIYIYIQIYIKHFVTFGDSGASAVGVCRACSGTVGEEENEEEEEEKRKNIEV